MLEQFLPFRHLSPMIQTYFLHFLQILLSGPMTEGRMPFVIETDHKANQD